METYEMSATKPIGARSLNIPIINGIYRSLVIFFKALSRNRSGMVGFVGLAFFFVFTVIGPLFVPFDDEPKLDQIAAPPGSRIQLMTRSEDVDRYKNFDDLVGHTLGVVDKSGGQLLLENRYPDGEMPFDVELYRFQSGRGLANSLDGLADGEVDALLVFSDTVRRLIDKNPDQVQAAKYSNLVISNDEMSAPLLLGTDTQGRDIFSHIVNGGSSLILVAVLAGFFSTTIAVVLGSVAALTGGYVDRLFVSTANFVLTIPQFPLLVVLALLIGRQLSNPFLLAALIAALSWPVLMRAVRAQVLSLREREFVEAARSLGLGLPHIVFREILPNMMSFVAINFIFAVTGAMYQQIGLIFLGMAPINEYTWGVMLFFGRTRGTLFSPDSMSMVLSPVMAIALFQVSMVLFARALEEMFDPRLRSA